MYKLGLSLFLVFLSQGFAQSNETCDRSNTVWMLQVAEIREICKCACIEGDPQAEGPSFLLAHHWQNGDGWEPLNVNNNPAYFTVTLNSGQRCSDMNMDTREPCSGVRHPNARTEDSQNMPSISWWGSDDVEMGSSIETTNSTSTETDGSPDSNSTHSGEYRCQFMGVQVNDAEPTYRYPLFNIVSATLQARTP